MANKIEEFGGGRFDCFADMGVCCFTCWCNICALSQALEDGGEMSCIANCCLMYCIPCWHPLYITVQLEAINVKMGGQDRGYCGECLCNTFCAPCTTCQLVRAIKAASAKGIVLKRAGAPMADEKMER